MYMYMDFDILTVQPEFSGYSCYNKIFVYNVNTDLVSNDGQFPMATGKDVDLLTSGPMCRYADDLLPLLKIFAGPESSKRVKLDEQVCKILSSFIHVVYS